MPRTLPPAHANSFPQPTEPSLIAVENLFPTALARSYQTKTKHQVAHTDFLQLPVGAEGVRFGGGSRAFDARRATPDARRPAPGSLEPGFCLADPRRPIQRPGIRQREPRSCLGELPHSECSHRMLRMMSSPEPHDPRDLRVHSRCVGRRGGMRLVRAGFCCVDASVFVSRVVSARCCCTSVPRCRPSVTARVSPIPGPV